MKDGDYTITNQSTGSTLIILLHPSDCDEIAISQRDAKGNKTAQQCRTRAEAETAIDRARAAGHIIAYKA